MRRPLGQAQRASPPSGWVLSLHCRKRVRHTSSQPCKRHSAVCSYPPSCTMRERTIQDAMSIIGLCVSPQWFQERSNVLWPQHKAA